MDLPVPPKGNFIELFVKFVVQKLDFHSMKLWRLSKLIFYCSICFFFSSDSALRNIIDKLAEFVARNGPEFEAITKAKQQGNPKFEFLYGGEYYLYYTWRVQSEQASKKTRHSRTI